MNAHELLVKDYTHCDGFVDAITRIPSSTNDEVELLGLRIDELREQKKEVDEALDKILTENRRMKDMRLEKAEKAARSLFLKRIFATLSYQNQRREVLHLRTVRSGLEKDLETSRQSNKDLQKKFEAAQEDWDRKREALE